MGRPCTVCQHPELAEIDAELVTKRDGYRVIALRWGVSRDALRRHQAAGHVSEALVQLGATKREQAASTVMGRVQALVETTEELLAGAKTAGSVVQALACIRELRGLLELQGKATGELRPDGAVTVLNVQSNPEWVVIRTAMLEALVAYPPARQAVAERLLALEAG